METEPAGDTGYTVLDESKKLIESGMLDSLVKARTLLSDKGLTETEQGRELDYIAYSLMSAVYPYYRDELGPGIPLKSSIYPDLVKEVKAGSVPAIKEENTNFFTLMLAAAAVFYSSEPDVVDTCLEIADQLGRFSPEGLYPYLIKGRGREVRGRNTESLEAYGKVLASFGDCYPALLGEARIYMSEGDYKNSENILEGLYSRYPDGNEIISLLVESYIKNGRNDEANRLLEEALSRQPDNVDLTLRRAGLLLTLGQVDKAEKLTGIFESVRGVTGKSIYIRAKILADRGKYRDAENLVKEYPAFLEGDLPLSILYGQILVLMGRYDEGLNFLEEKLREYPGNEDFSRLLLDVYIKKSKWKDALSLVDSLLKPDSSTELKRAAVRIYYKMKMYDKAYSLNEAILTKDNPGIDDYVYRVKLLINKGLKIEAMKEIDGWLLKTDTASDRSILYYYKSLCTDSISEKKEYLQQALFENLQNLDAIVSLADIYESSGEYRKAYRYLKQAAIIDPGNSDIRNKLKYLEGRIK